MIMYLWEFIEMLCWRREGDLFEHLWFGERWSVVDEYKKSNDSKDKDGEEYLILLGLLLIILDKVGDMVIMIFRVHDD